MICMFKYVFCNFICGSLLLSKCQNFFEIIFVLGASSGDKKCFDRFNPTGNFNGHCGRSPATGEYLKCDAE